MRRRRLPGLALSVATALILAACSPSPAGSRPTPSGSGASSTPPASLHGTATVDYAGSLTGLVQTTLQPAFEKATGDSFVGKGAGSTLIENGILDGELSPGAFVSIGKKAISSLWPSLSHFVLTLATDPLVVAYSSKSRYAAQLNKIRTGARPLRDLFSLFESPGFRLGRTDPTQDPQGAFFILMVELATRELHLPPNTVARALGVTSSNPVGNSSQVVDENALGTDIAAGAVDAGSDFVTEARQFHLEYISLPASLDFAAPADLSRYTSVTLRLPGGPFPGGLITLDATYVEPAHGSGRSPADAAADQAWLAFLLGHRGQSLLRRAGYVLGKPVAELAAGFHSARSALPAPVYSAFERSGGTVSAS